MPEKKSFSVDKLENIEGHLTSNESSLFSSSARFQLSVHGCAERAELPAPRQQPTLLHLHVGHDRTAQASRAAAHEDADGLSHREDCWENNVTQRNHRLMKHKKAFSQRG